MQCSEPGPRDDLARDAHDATAADSDRGDARDRVFFGGFLALYKETPDDGRLHLPKKTVSNILMNENGALLPVNVNHDEGAVVGSVFRLFDLEAGLFCVGEIYSETFLDIIDKASALSKIVLVGPKNGLKPDPTLEYLSGSYPGLSLSSSPLITSDKNDTESTSFGTEDDRFFKHVAICGVGRRRGTLGVYGRNIEWILDRFSLIKPGERRDIASQTAPFAQSSTWRAMLGNADPFRSDALGLLANSVDTAYIKQRLAKLEYDKKLALDRDRGTYIKASEVPCSGDVDKCIIKVKKDSDSPSHVQNMTQPGPSSVSQSHAVPPHGAVLASPASLPSDYVYLSKDAFLSILGANRLWPPSQPATVAAPMGHVAGSVQEPRAFDQRSVYDGWQMRPPPQAYPYEYAPMMRQAVWQDPATQPLLRYSRDHDVGYPDDRARLYRRDAHGPADVYGPGGRDYRGRDVEYVYDNETRGVRQVKRREYDADMSFPGDSDYHRTEKRPRRERSPPAKGARRETSPAESAGYEELCSVISDLRRDITHLKSAVPSHVPMQPSSPGTATSSTIAGDSDAVKGICQEVSDMAVDVMVTNGKKGRIKDDKVPIVVNASCTPHQNAARTPTLLDVNKKMFVTALQKME